MLLSVLLQAAAAGVGVSTVGAALHASRKHREIFV